jgi:hypothetical protein
MKFAVTSFHHELVNGNLASEYETEIRLWLRDVFMHGENGTKEQEGDADRAALAETRTLTGRLKSQSGDSVPT